MSPKTKLVLPFELSKTSRQETFKNRLEQYAFKIDKISYQLINGYNKSEDKNGSVHLIAFSRIILLCISINKINHCMTCCKLQLYFLHGK